MIVSTQLDQFRALVASRLGLQIDGVRVPELTALIERRLAATGSNAEHYLTTCTDDAAELQEIAGALTINESYFFRHIGQFRALADHALPAIVSAMPVPRGLRLLSAGCASGEEAYSLAMTLKSHADILALGRPEIVGVDIDAAALRQASIGRYAPWALRETPIHLQQRWFRPQGREYVLAGEIRDMVSLVQQNLAGDAPALWRSGSFDVVFCRNVLIHFAPEQARRLLDRLAGLVAPGGFLFLGHAEALRV